MLQGSCLYKIFCQTIINNTITKLYLWKLAKYSALEHSIDAVTIVNIILDRINLKIINLITRISIVLVVVVASMVVKVVE